MHQILCTRTLRDHFHSLLLSISAPINFSCKHYFADQDYIFDMRQNLTAKCRVLLNKRVGLKRVTFQLTCWMKKLESPRLRINQIFSLPNFQYIIQTFQCWTLLFTQKRRRKKTFSKLLNAFKCNTHTGAILYTFTWDSWVQIIILLSTGPISKGVLLLSRSAI